MKKETKIMNEVNEKEEKKISKLPKRISYFISCFMSAMMFTTPVFASSGYLEPINKLKTVAISIVAAGGVIVLIFGGVKFAEAFQKKDQNGEYSAIYTIIAGAIMTGISAFIAALT